MIAVAGSSLELQMVPLRPSRSAVINVSSVSRGACQRRKMGLICLMSHGLRYDRFHLSLEIQEMSWEEMLQELYESIYLQDCNMRILNKSPKKKKKRNHPMRVLP